MADTIDYKAIAEAKGFQFYDKCNCGGTLQMKFKHRDGFHLSVMPVKQMFVLKKDHRTIFTGKLILLQKSLDEQIF